MAIFAELNTGTMAKTTDKAGVSTATGLTKVQEEACILLARGEEISAIAEQLGVTQDSLFLWQKQPTFKCYYNRQRSIIRHAATQGVYALAGEALSTLRDCLGSINDSVRLKAATFILDKLQADDVGTIDIVEEVRAEATYDDSAFLGSYFHEDEYRQRLDALGVEEQDYEESRK